MQPKGRSIRLVIGFLGVVGSLLLLSGTDGVGGRIDEHTGTQSFSFPAEAITFQSGPGGKLAATYCLICHSADYIYMQPPFDQHKWKAIVHRMKEAFVCPISEGELEPLVEYLVSQSGRQPLRVAVSIPTTVDETGISGNPLNGKVLFERHCVICHGSQGKGDGPIGRALVPPAADLTSEDVRNDPDEELLGIIRNGKLPSAMPAWKETLSEQEIRDLLAYVRSMAAPSQ